MKIKKIKFVNNANSSSKTKFGGQPNWLLEPQWPLSKELKSPMRFIGQINLGDVYPVLEGKWAYIFMTEDDNEYVDGTWEPDGGENAVIIQPDGMNPLEIIGQATGPSREEYGIEIIETEIDDGDLEGCRLGGTPEFMQGEEFPEPKSEWLFLAQLDSCSLPFEVNFGDAGIAYIFVSVDGSVGKFLWQCG